MGEGDKPGLRVSPAGDRVGAGAAKSSPSRQSALPCGWYILRVGGILEGMGVNPSILGVNPSMLGVNPSILGVKLSIMRLFPLKIGNVFAKFWSKKFHFAPYLNDDAVEEKELLPVSLLELFSFSPFSSSSSLPVATSTLWYSLDFSSRYAWISTSLSRSAGLRPCFATGFWHFSSIFYGFLINIRCCYMYGYLWWIDTV